MQRLVRPSRAAPRCRHAAGASRTRSGPAHPRRRAANRQLRRAAGGACPRPTHRPRPPAAPTRASGARPAPIRRRALWLSTPNDQAHRPGRDNQRDRQRATRELRTNQQTTWPGPVQRLVRRAGVTLAVHQRWLTSDRLATHRTTPARRTRRWGPARATSTTQMQPLVVHEHPVGPTCPSSPLRPCRRLHRACTSTGAALARSTRRHLRLVVPAEAALCHPQALHRRTTKLTGPAATARVQTTTRRELPQIEPRGRVRCSAWFGPPGATPSRARAPALRRPTRAGQLSGGRCAPRQRPPMRDDQRQPTPDQPTAPPPRARRVRRAPRLGVAHTRDTRPASARPAASRCNRAPTPAPPLNSPRRTTTAHRPGRDTSCDTNAQEPAQNKRRGRVRCSAWFGLCATRSRRT